MHGLAIKASYTLNQSVKGLHIVLQTMVNRQNWVIAFFWSWSYWSTFLLTWYAFSGPGSACLIWVCVAHIILFIQFHELLMCPWVDLLMSEGQAIALDMCFMNFRAQ